MFIHQGRQKTEGKRKISQKAQNTTIESQAATRLRPTSENQRRGFPTTNIRLTKILAKAPTTSM